MAFQSETLKELFITNAFTARHNNLHFDGALKEYSTERVDHNHEHLTTHMRQLVPIRYCKCSLSSLN